MPNLPRNKRLKPLRQKRPQRQRVKKESEWSDYVQVSIEHIVYRGFKPWNEGNRDVWSRAEGQTVPRVQGTTQSEFVQEGKVLHITVEPNVKYWQLIGELPPKVKMIELFRLTEYAGSDFACRWRRKAVVGWQKKRHVKFFA